MPREYNKQDDVLSGSDVTLDNASLLDFWHWAFRDLCDDDIKGIFAEWMILKLLDLPGIRRISWANNDLVTTTGVTIEVKATAYWQSWKLLDAYGRILETPARPMSSEETIGFGGLTANDSEATNQADKARTYKSELYFFAFQNEKNPDVWNAMDLRQWEFYALRKSELTGARSIKLKTLRAKFERLSAAGFAQKARGMIAEVESRIPEQNAAKSS
jgi:hypothetical protein